MDKAFGNECRWQNWKKISPAVRYLVVVSNTQAHCIFYLYSPNHLLATHQLLSRAAVDGYCAVSHDYHVYTTWRESDWRDRIQEQAPESARCIPDPFPP